MDIRLHRGQKLFLPILLGLSISLSSCLKELEKMSKAKIVNWNPDVAVPIFDDTLSLRDIVSRINTPDKLIINKDGYYTFLFSGNLKTPELQDQLIIPDQVIGDINTPVPAVPGNSQTIINNDLVLSPGEGRNINYIDFKRGRIEIDYANTVAGTSVTLSFPDIRRNGLPLTRTLTGSAGSGLQLDLTGYTLDIVNKPAADSNKVSLQIAVANNNSGASLPGTLRLAMRLNDVGFSFIRGYLGQFTLQQRTNESIDLSIFDKNFLGDNNEIYLSDPSVSVLASNSSGMPVVANVTNLSSQVLGSSPKPLTGAAIDSLADFKLKVATLTSPIIGPGTTRLDTTKFLIDKNNSNLVSGNFLGFFENSPQKLNYSLRASTNYGGNTGNKAQFAFDTSAVRMKVTVQLPMKGRVRRLTVQDTFQVSLPVNDPEYQVVDSAIVRLLVTNGFPCQVAGQLIFVRSDGLHIDSLIAGNSSDVIALAANIDANGKVPNQDNQPKFTKIFKIDGARYDRIQRNTDIIVFRATIQTTDVANNRDVEIYPEYRLRTQLGVQVRTSVSLNSK